VDHLFAGCVVSREVWFRVLEPADLQLLLDGQSEDGLCTWWLKKRQLLDSERRRGFDALVLLVSWELWKERNARIFRNEAKSMVAIAKHIKEEGELWIDAGFTPLAAVWAFFQNDGVTLLVDA
jgi:hypothetical protein